MATGDASPRGFYSAEAADEDRVWRRHAPAPELESTTARFRAADLAGDLPKIPRPESRCVAGTRYVAAEDVTAGVAFLVGDAERRSQAAASAPPALRLLPSPAPPARAAR